MKDDDDRNLLGCFIASLVLMIYASGIGYLIFIVANYIL